MKKIIAMASICTMLIGTVSALPVSAEEQTYRIGDVDMDGKLTAFDAQLIFDCQHALAINNPSPLTEQQMTLADFDRDGEITLKDATEILLYLDHLPYDVNLDGKVDIEDAKLAAAAYAEFQKEHPGEELTWKNIDDDFILSPLQVASFLQGCMDSRDFGISPIAIQSFCKSKLQIPPGDIDLDGTVSLNDATTILTVYCEQAVGNTFELTPLQSILCDVDRNDTLTLDDATTALTAYAEVAVNNQS